MKSSDVTIQYNSMELNNNSETSSDQNAIIFLCMLNEHYVIASCVSAWVHRYLIEKSKRNIKLIIMCDTTIYAKWRNTLIKYFDEVVKIDLLEYKLAKQYEYAKHKYNWLQYSINKWQCLKFEQYDKVLFCDVDILPVDTKFYEIFDMSAPAFNCNMPIPTYTKQSTMRFKMTHGNMTFQLYIGDGYKYVGSIDGGLCLLKPSKKLYDEYVKFTRNVFSAGMYATYKSGPDETSLYYFYLCVLKSEISVIDYATCIVPWDVDIYTCKNALSYNFLSFVKPWLKYREFQWIEETLWSDLIIKMGMPDELRNLVQFQQSIQHKKYLQMAPREQRKYYGRNELHDNARQNYGMLDIKDIHDLVCPKN